MPYPFGFCHTCGTKPVKTIADEVKLHAVVFPAREKAGAVLVVGVKCLKELWTDFVGLLADRRADRDFDLRSLRSECVHGIQRCLKNAVQRAFPPGVGPADDTRLGVRSRAELLSLFVNPDPGVG